MNQGKHGARWRVDIGVFAARPKLLIAIVLGLAVGSACAFAFPTLAAASCWIAGWNAFCVVFTTLLLISLGGRGPAGIRASAAREDEGQAVILLLILAACVASIVAVAMELSLARATHGMDKALHVSVAFATVAISWLLMQFVFALHYAHDYYAADPDTGKDHGGLKFPGGQEPDLWDFLHFAIVIGVASQTADVSFTSRRTRHVGTVHSLVAFAFNTVVLALTVNLLAGLF